MAQWKKDLKREEKRREKKEEKEGRKNEIRKFEKAEEAIEKEKNKGKLSSALGMEVKKGEKLLKSIGGKRENKKS